MFNSPSSGQRHSKTRKRVFGLSHLRSAFTGHNVDPFDYKKKYEEDEYGKEWDANARVWRVYLDEAQVFDLEMTEGWKDTLDVFLVFAGLFSAVVATFLGISVPALQPDYGQITASLLREVIEMQRAVALGHSPDSVSPSSIDKLPPSQTGDRWVNALWFISLTLSLCTALTAVLIKQWIQQYTKFVSGTPLEQVRRRQLRYDGLEQWGVPVIIGLMPLLLHVSLFLYLGGLVVFILPLDETTGSVVCGIAAIALVAYFVSNSLPLVFLHCPYITPISIHVHDLVLAPLIHLLKIITLAAKRFHWDSSRPFMSRSQTYQEAAARKSLQSKEDDAVAQNSDNLKMRAVMWLHSISSNPTVSDIALKSISALPIWIPQSARGTLRDNLQESLSTSLGEKYNEEWDWIAGSFHPQGVLTGETSMTTVERLARAIVQIADPRRAAPAHLPAYRMLLAAGQVEDSYSPELVLVGYFNSANHGDPLHRSDTDQDRMRYQALLYELRDANPSLWTSCIRRLIEATPRPMSQYTSDSYQTPPLLSLLNLIPAGLFSEAIVPRNDYIKWSLLIRYMITCFYPPLPHSPAGKDAQLYNCLVAYSKHEHIDGSSPEHRRLTALLFCHLLIAFFEAELIPPKGIDELLEPFYGIASLLKAKITVAPDKKQQPLISGSPRSELVAVVRKLLHKAIQQSIEFSATTANLMIRLFIGLFDQPEIALEDDDYFACLQVMQLTKTDVNIKWFMLGYEDHLKLMGTLARFMETCTPASLRINSTRIPNNIHGRHCYEALFTQKNILSLYQVLASYMDRTRSAMMGWVDDSKALEFYTQQLLQISLFEGSKSKVNVAAFSALRELLYSSPGHEKVRFNGTHGSEYIHALMTKLQKLDPQRGGFDKVNEDGTLQFAVYRRVQRATEVEVMLEGSLSLQSTQFVKTLCIDQFGLVKSEAHLEHWITEPIAENDLAEIFESSVDTGPSRGS